MPAAYDSYNYPAYWEGREYEHKAEVFALKKFLERIPSVKSLLEIGAGYGRLVSAYEYRAKNIVLADPSARLLKIAREVNTGKKIKFVQSSLSSLKNKFKRGAFDLVILVRVLHHIKDLEEAFAILEKLVKPGGYLILEFPNKKHMKANIKQFLKGNTTYPLDIFTTDKNSKEASLPFCNYHPDVIFDHLDEANFRIIQKRSVSNIRSRHAKRWFSTNILYEFEKYLQLPLAYSDFGPSIFILAQKDK